MYNGDVDRETVSFGGREATTGNASAVRKLRNGGHVNKMRLDTTYAKRNCSTEDNLNSGHKPVIRNTSLIIL